MLDRFSGRAPLAAALGLVCTIANAQAADLGPYSNRQRWDAPQASYYPTAFRWSGMYAGLQAGYGWTNTDAISTSIGTGISQGFSYGSSGALGGAHLGYNWQSGNFVLGAETDLELSGISGSGVGSLGGGHATSLDWQGSLRARLGFTTGSTLFYATGGLAYGGISIDRSATPTNTPFTGDSFWKTGWTLGAGIEHAFTQTISARIEYRYTDFGQMTFTSPGAGISDTSDITQSAIRAGLSFKF